MGTRGSVKVTHCKNSEWGFKLDDSSDLPILRLNSITVLNSDGEHVGLYELVRELQEKF